MCGRYLVITEEEILEMRAILEEINERFHSSGDIRQPPDRREVYPGQISPIFVSDGDSVAVEPMKWGFTRWDGKGSVINARAETVEMKPFFRDSYQTRRCVIPSSGFFEWKRPGSSGGEDLRAGKYLIRRACSPILLMAGIWKSTDGHREFTIITMPSAESIRNLHDRMPLFMEISQIAPWLRKELSLADILTQEKAKERLIPSLMP